MVLVQVTRYVCLAEWSGLKSVRAAIKAEQKISDCVARSARDVRRGATITGVQHYSVVVVAVPTQKIGGQISLLNKAAIVKPDADRVLSADHADRIGEFPGGKIAG